MVCLGWFTLDNFLNYSATNLIKFLNETKDKISNLLLEMIYSWSYLWDREWILFKEIFAAIFYLMFTRREGPFHKTFKVPASEMKYAKGLPNVGVQCCCGIVVNSYFIVTTTSTSQMFVYYCEHINLSPIIDWSLFEATAMEKKIYHNAN